MTGKAAILANGGKSEAAKVAAAAWMAKEPELVALGINNNKRRAMLIGQCGHESARFRSRFENLNYSASALWQLFSKYFKNEAECEVYQRKPEMIANRIYGGRMGNGAEASGEGYRYRGRGYLQLTGKSNYTKFGNALGLDLVGDPDQAADPEVSWCIAAHYCATRIRSGKSLLEWADEGDTLMVTKGINGGTHGLSDRISQTETALSVLSGKLTVADKQGLLAAAGFEPGPIDGLMGSKTRSATNAAKAALGIGPPELWEKLRKKA